MAATNHFAQGGTIVPAYPQTRIGVGPDEELMKKAEAGRVKETNVLIAPGIGGSKKQFDIKFLDVVMRMTPQASQKIGIARKTDQNPEYDRPVVIGAANGVPGPEITSVVAKDEDKMRVLTMKWMSAYRPLGVCYGNYYRDAGDATRRPHDGVPMMITGQSTTYSMQSLAIGDRVVILPDLGDITAAVGLKRQRPGAAEVKFTVHKYDPTATNPMIAHAVLKYAETIAAFVNTPQRSLLAPASIPEKARAGIGYDEDVDGAAKLMQGALGFAFSFCEALFESGNLVYNPAGGGSSLQNRGSFRADMMARLGVGIKGDAVAFRPQFATAVMKKMFADPALTEVGANVKVTKVSLPSPGAHSVAKNDAAILATLMQSHVDGKGFLLDGPVFSAMSPELQNALTQFPNVQDLTFVTWPPSAAADIVDDLSQEFGVNALAGTPPTLPTTTTIFDSGGFASYDEDPILKANAYQVIEFAPSDPTQPGEWLIGTYKMQVDDSNASWVILKQGTGGTPTEVNYETTIFLTHAAGKGNKTAHLDAALVDEGLLDGGKLAIACHPFDG